MLEILSGWRSVVAGAVLLLAAVLGVWLYGQHRYRVGVADERAAAEVAAAKQYAKQAESLNAEAAELRSKIEALENEKPKIITQYKDRIVRVPLPADCTIDAGRLHDIQSAVHAANAAR
jgi:hypothetical protein